MIFLNLLIFNGNIKIILNIKYILIKKFMKKLGKNFFIRFPNLTVLLLERYYNVLDTLVH